jgi:long-chain acyl-CoA synthetase
MSLCKSPFVTQATDVPEREGETLPYRSTLCKDGVLVNHYYKDAKTIYESFQRGLRLSHDRPFLGVRALLDGKRGDYVWQTYSVVNERATHVGSGLKAKGFGQMGSNIGIFSINMPEWMIVDIACFSYK